MSALASQPAASVNPALTSAYLKSRWRLMPFLMLIYGLGFVDRVNVSYAQLSMRDKLAFSDEIYGLGAGILFVGYFLFEIPSNLYLARNGARRTLALIMVLWGLASVLTAVITTPLQFYAVRFFVGVFEAGLFPGVVLYLSYWFPAVYRGRVFSLLLMSMLIANTLASPVSGWILENWDGDGGLANWQWLFILEGFPSVLFGVIALFVLIDRPRDATWLSDAEKQAIDDQMRADEGEKPPGTASHRESLLDPKVYILAFGLFAVLCGYYGVMFWLPTIIRENGITNMFELGLYAIIPNVLAAVAMFLIARRSDATGERRWHFAIPLVIAALGLAFAVMQTKSLGLSLAALSFGLAGVMSCFPTFWAIATDYLPARRAAFGIALINSIAATGGFVSPYTVGFIKTATGSMMYAFVPTITVMVLAAIVMVLGVSADRLRRAS